MSGVDDRVARATSVCLDDLVATVGLDRICSGREGRSAAAWSAMLAAQVSAGGVTLGTSVPGSSSSDRADVEAAARDYIEGWYTGDAERMERSLHRELVKRTCRKDDPAALREVTRARMVEMTADGGGGGRMADAQISIDDISDGMAAARVVSPDFVDYLHLVNTPDGWRIANVLFRNRG